MATPLLALLLATLLLGACGGPAENTATDGAPTDPMSAPINPSPSEPTGDTTQPRPSDKSPEPAKVPETLDFSATTVGGDAFEGVSLAGRPTLLWFWAPWCPTCRSQISQVEGLASTYDGDLHVIGVGSLDSAEAIAEFARDVEGVTHLEDSEGELFKRFGIAEQSSFVLLDADGEVAYETGYGGSDDLGQQVEAVVG